MRFERLLSTVALLLGVAGASLYGQAPRTMSYQGILVDGSGNPIPNGQHALAVSIYDASNGGSPLHTESFVVNVANGLFGVVIGANKPVDASIAFDRSYYLGVSVDGGVEMAPRTALTASPYAMNAARADVAGGLAPGATGVVTSVNNISGDLKFVGEGSTVVSSNGRTITISSTGGAGAGGIQGIGNNDGSLTVLNASGPTADISVADGGVHALKLADNAVITQKLATNAVTNEKLAFNAVNTINIVDASVSAPKLMDGSVTAPKLAADAVNTANIANGAVTLGKIAPNGALPGQALMLSGGALTWGYPTAGDVRFPLTDTINNADYVLSVANSGTGGAGRFAVTSGSSTTSALWAETNGLGPALYVYGKPTSSPNAALSVKGNSTAIFSRADGATGSAAILRTYNNANSSDAVVMSTAGIGNVMVANHTGASGNIAIFQNSGANVVRIDKTGKGYFNGGTQASGADVAEAFNVVGPRDGYEPGDVLVISTAGDRRVEKSSESYSTRVVGVYATKPGVLLTPYDIDADISGLVPMGVVGVIPTKVCGENGAIHRGDLLVTSSTPGYAMRATEGDIRFGSVIGKALQDFDGEGKGIIEVMVNVK